METTLKNQKRIAVLVDYYSVFQRELIEGIRKVFEPLGFCTIVTIGRELEPVDDYYQGANHIYDLVRHCDFDGYIIVSSVIGHNVSRQNLIDFVEQYSHKPCVSVGIEIPNVPSVVIDNRSGMIAMVRHLVEFQNHRRFAFMRGFEHNIDSRERENTLVEVLADYDLELEPELIISGNYQSSFAVEATHELLAKRNDFDVFVAANDQMAYGITTALNQHGLKVPDDVAVVGFDDRAESFYHVPPLTTVNQPFESLGTQAAKLLLDEFDGTTKALKNSVPTQLVIRQSCGLNSKRNQSLNRQGGTELLSDSSQLIQSVFEDGFFTELLQDESERRVFQELFLSFLSIDANDIEFIKLWQRFLQTQPMLNVHRYQQFLELLQTNVVDALRDPKRLNLAQETLRDAWEIVEKFNRQALNAKTISYLNADSRVRRNQLSLTTVENYNDLYEKLDETLREVVERAFVLLYDDSEDRVSETSTLCVTIDADLEETSKPISFQTKHILPLEFRRYLTGTFHLMPLHVGVNNYGCVLIDGNDPQIFKYDSFVYDIALAMRNSSQIERLEAHAEKLQKANVELATLAQFDSLTGLANRSLLTQRLEEACFSAQKNNHKIAVFFLDLDGFKFVNDSLGHDRGDQLLQMVSDRLTSIVKAEDTVSRLGGDEFTIVVGEIENQEDAIKIAERINNTFTAPFRIQASRFKISASVGIALYPTDAREPSDLMKFADAAMYKAKADGKNRFRFYNTKLSEDVFKELQLSESLRIAIDTDELWLAYQPRFDLQTLEIISFEALVRWTKQDGEIISPGTFIPVAEKNGLIHDIGRLVLRQACLQAKAWSGCVVMDSKPPTVSVNLSVNQLHEDDIVEQIAVIIAEAGLEPSLLELEITESAAMIDIEKNIEKLRLLKDMGIKIAIDDFGTAYSSLSYLNRLPITSLKIDRSFVKDIEDINDMTKNTAVIRAVIALGKSLGFNLVAEGIETEVQLEFLRQFDCNEAQGFLLGKPMSHSEASALLGISKDVDFEPQPKFQQFNGL